MTYRLLRRILLIVSTILLGTAGVIFLYSSELTSTEWTITLYNVIIRTFGALLLYIVLLMLRAALGRL
jgi:hypothetical protein